MITNENLLSELLRLVGPTISFDEGRSCYTFSNHMLCLYVHYSDNQIKTLIGIIRYIQYYLYLNNKIILDGVLYIDDYKDTNSYSLSELFEILKESKFEKNIINTNNNNLDTIYGSIF